MQSWTSWLVLQLFVPVGIGQNHTTSELILLSSDTFLAHSKMLTCEELNGLLYYQNSIFFQFQGAKPPGPLTRGSAPGPRSARHVVPPLFRRNRRHWVKHSYTTSIYENVLCRFSVPFLLPRNGPLIINGAFRDNFITIWNGRNKSNFDFNYKPQDTQQQQNWLHYSKCAYIQKSICFCCYEMNEVTTKFYKLVQSNGLRRTKN